MSWCQVNPDAAGVGFGGFFFRAKVGSGSVGPLTVQKKICYPDARDACTYAQGTFCSYYC